MVTFETKHKGLCTKNVHPKGEEGLEIVDENGHRGRGVLAEWMSTFPDFPKYNCEQNLKHQKSPKMTNDGRPLYTVPN